MANKKHHQDKVKWTESLAKQAQKTSKDKQVHHFVSKSRFQEFPSVGRKVLGSISGFMPGVLKRWLDSRFIASDLPVSCIIEALQYFSESGESETVVEGSEGGSFQLNLENIQESLYKMHADKIEELFVYRHSLSHNLWYQLLADVHDANLWDVDRFLNVSPQKILLALVLVRENKTLYQSVVEALPASLVQKLIPKLSQTLFLDFIQLLALESLHVLISSISSEKMALFFQNPYLSNERRVLLATYLSAEQAKASLNGFETEDEEFLHRFLEKLSPKSLAETVFDLEEKNQKKIMGSYWHRPMGISMAIANGKMATDQVCCGILNPLTTQDILNSVEWMSNRQLRAVQELLSCICAYLRYCESSGSSIELTEKNPVLLAASEVAYLKKQKYHQLYPSISSIALEMDRLSLPFYKQN